MKAKRLAAQIACCLLVGSGWCTPSQAQGTRVPITEFVVTGNTLLRPDALDAALARFKGERTLDELKQAAQAVQELYRAAGYAAVIAYVPEQTDVPGRATIAVVEGHIARIEVIGNSRFSEANIKRSVPALAIGVTPQVRRLDTQIQMANENPAKRLSLTLEPGKQPGDVDASLLVVEQSPSLWTAAVDNSGNSTTGKLRGYLRYQQAALWDLDHVLSLQVATSLERPADAASYGGNYRIPMYGLGMTADIYAAYSNVDGGNTFTAAGPLQFNGKGEVLGVLFNKYLQRAGGFDQQVGLGLDLRKFLNECSIEGLPEGACGSSGASVTVNPLSINYSAQRAGKYPVSFNASVSRNLGLAGPNSSSANFDAVRSGAPKYYVLARLGGSGTVPLPRQWQLQARVNGQLTPDALIPGEQFGIAGANSVRGYLEREVIGDRGVDGSVELYTPALVRPLGSQQSMLQLLGFVDAGKVWNHLNTPCVGTQSSCSLWSYGAGVRAALGTLQLRLDIAHAMKAGKVSSAGENRANFLATYVF